MRFGDAVRSLGFGLFGAGLMLLLYWMFVRLLWEIKIVQIIGSLLVIKLTAMTFLTTFLMIIFSSTLASLTTLFLARDLAFLIASPLPFSRVFLFKFLETAVFSSWMVLLVMVPFVAALGEIYQLGWAFYGIVTVLAVPYVLLAAIVGAGLSMGLMCFFPSRRVRDVMIVFGVLVGGSMYILFRWLEPERLVRADSLEFIVQYISLLEAPMAPYLPSWWMTSLITHYIAGRIGPLVQTGCLLVGSTLVGGTLLILFARAAYYNGWTAAQEGQRRRKKTPLGKEWVWLPSLGNRRIRALLAKDILIFFRDTAQWSQGILLAALAVVYLLSIRQLPLDTPYLRGLISFLNIGMVGFVLAAVSLRFVFPAVSLEGRSWWSLRCAPVSLWVILWEKFIMGFVPLLILGSVLVVVSNHLLRVDAFVRILSGITVVVMALALTGMGLGFGSLFPRFHVENVAQIETSPGGILFMICGLFYVALTLALEAVLMRMHYFSLIRPGDFSSGPVVWAVVGALVALNVGVVGIPLVLGKWHLEKADL